MCTRALSAMACRYSCSDHSDIPREQTPGGIMLVSPLLAEQCISRHIPFASCRSHIQLGHTTKAVARSLSVHHTSKRHVKVQFKDLHVKCATGPDASDAGSVGRTVNRRSITAATLALGLLAPTRALAGMQQQNLVEFVNSKQGYRIERPSAWEQTSKAGADVLFADPAKKSTTVGVTVSPIKIAGLEQFGDVETVRKKLINTEKQKESTKDVALVRESSRKGKSGTLIYDIEYELDSTRGRKRILSSVGIAQKKLFIVNGNLKCDASGCTEADNKDIAILRQVAGTFDIV